MRRDFSWLLASKLACMAAGLLPVMLLNRALAPAGRGVLAEMQSWVALFAVVFGLSLESAVYHLANAREHPEPQADKFITLMWATLAGAGAAALALALGARMFPGLLPAQAGGLLPPMCALLVLTMLGTQLGVFFQAHGEIPFISKLTMAQTAASALLVGAGHLCGALSVPFALWALVAAQLPLAGLALAAACRRGLLGGRPSWAMARKHLAAGARLHVATIATFAYTRLNQILVNRYAGDHEAGLFAAALNLAFTAMLIPQALQGALYPRVIHSTDEAQVTRRSMRLTFWLWGGACAVLALLAEPILLVYGGERFLDAVPAFRLCLAALFFLSLSSLVAPLFVKRGAFTLASVISVTLAAIGLGLNLLLIPGHGESGSAAARAALATALTTACGLAAMLLFYRHLTRGEGSPPMAPQPATEA